MKFLELLIALLSKIFSNTDSLPRTVDPQERITRYITRKSYFKNGIKKAVFIPSNTHNNTSIYRINHCNNEKVWWLGDTFVTPSLKEKKPILARADLNAKNIFNLKLDIEPQNPPHPRHANIIKWPSDKIEVKAKAQKLADEASLYFHPNSQL